MHNISNLQADLIQQQKTTPGESKNSKLRLHTGSLKVHNRRLPGSMRLDFCFSNQMVGSD